MEGDSFRRLHHHGLGQSREPDSNRRSACYQSKCHTPRRPLEQLRERDLNPRSCGYEPHGDDQTPLSRFCVGLYTRTPTWGGLTFGGRHRCLPTEPSSGSYPFPLPAAYFGASLSFEMRNVGGYPTLRFIAGLSLSSDVAFRSIRCAMTDADVNRPLGQRVSSPYVLSSRGPQCATSTIHFTRFFGGCNRKGVLDCSLARHQSF